MDSVKMPDILYSYLVYCRGSRFVALSEHSDVDGLWDEIERGQRLILWGPLKNNRYSNLRLNPSTIVAIDDSLGKDPIHPNRIEQRKEDINRREVRKNPGASTMSQPIPRQR